MAEIVRMPKLSDTMTDGVIATWHKKVGDKVKSGELLADIETDKATMEFESFQDGVLLHIGVQEKQPVPVDSVIAILGKEGEDISGLLNGSTGGKAEERQPELPHRAAAPRLPVRESRRRTGAGHSAAGVPAAAARRPRAAGMCCRMTSATASGSRSYSGITMPSAPPAIPAMSAR